jgi:hypothetical protein
MRPASRRPVGRVRLRLRAAVLGLAVLVTACAGAAPGDSGGSAGPADGTSDAVDEEIYGGFPVDPPAPDEVVLTLEGNLRIELTMAELEGLAVDEVTLDEPFVRRRETFRVIPLAELFALAGIEDGQTVQTIALNDYRYADSVSALLGAQALLAVARDGAPIPMDAGGPIRIVFADDSSYAQTLDAWNWSLRTIRVAEPGTGGP